MTGAQVIETLDAQYGPVVTYAELRRVLGRTPHWLRSRLYAALRTTLNMHDDDCRDWLRRNFFTFKLGPFTMTATDLDGLVWRVRGGEAGK